MAIALSDLARGTNVTRPGALDGDVWRMGVYRIDTDSKPGSSKELVGENGAWNPTGTWFHRPWLFGRVVFTDGPATP